MILHSSMYVKWSTSAWDLKNYHLITKFKIYIDDAVKFTSEMHDPCAQTVTYKEKKMRTPYRRHRCGAGRTPSEG